MDLEKIEEAMKKMVESLDKAARLEAVLEDKDEFRVILSKGTHSDRATLSREVLEEFLERGKGGHEVKKAIGKVISKLNLSAQKRR
jgi:ribosome-associated translation inhibitor RaiA